MMRKSSKQCVGRMVDQEGVEPSTPALPGSGAYLAEQPATSAPASAISLPTNIPDVLALFVMSAAFGFGDGVAGFVTTQPQDGIIGVADDLTHADVERAHGIHFVG